MKNGVQSIREKKKELIIDLIYLYMSFIVVRHQFYQNGKI